MDKKDSKYVDIPLVYMPEGRIVASKQEVKNIYTVSHMKDSISKQDSDVVIHNDDGSISIRVPEGYVAMEKFFLNKFLFDYYNRNIVLRSIILPDSMRVLGMDVFNTEVKSGFKYINTRHLTHIGSSSVLFDDVCFEKLSLLGNVEIDCANTGEVIYLDNIKGCYAAFVNADEKMIVYGDQYRYGKIDTETNCRTIDLSKCKHYNWMTKNTMSDNDYIERLFLPYELFSLHEGAISGNSNLKQIVTHGRITRFEKYCLANNEKLEHLPSFEHAELVHPTALSGQNNYENLADIKLKAYIESMAAEWKKGKWSLPTEVENSLPYIQRRVNSMLKGRESDIIIKRQGVEYEHSVLIKKYNEDIAQIQDEISKLEHAITECKDEYSHNNKAMMSKLKHFDYKINTIKNMQKVLKKHINKIK